MANVELLISVNSDYLDRMPELVEKLRAAGMTNIQSRDLVGIITGLLDEDKLVELCELEGIEQVERSQDVQIPPPDSPIQ